MKKLLLFAAALCSAAVVSATPLWMRYNTISPQGDRIAFAYQGDIYVVPTAGGEAQKLVATSAHEYMPVWSPDGKTIAYASDETGNFDIYMISLAGGNPVRLTTNSMSESPLCFTADGKEVLFSAAIQKPASSVQYPSPWIKELYAVRIAQNSRPRQIFTVPAMNASVSADGNIIYYEKATGSENNWRKHHVSSVARDIFSYDIATKQHHQLTTNVGEDRNPIIAANGTVYFLSERDLGSFNIYSAPANNMESVTKVSNHKTHPVRFLSAANDGLLCYGYMGEIYTQRPGEKAKKVNISIRAEIPTDSVKMINIRHANEFDMTPDGSQIIYASRGEIFAVTNEYATTKQITKTAAAERGISIHKDGRKVVFASERSGKWALYTAEIERTNEVNFANATLINERPIFSNEKHERFAPQFSPDGKEIAFIQDRNKLVVYNIESKKTRQITDGSKHVRNDDYGFTYSWSPDCKWFVMEIISNIRDPYADIAIVSATDGGKYHNITNSAYIDHSPRWALDGNAITYISNRYGMRAHASWGSQDDVFIAYLNQDTYDKYNLTTEEYDLKKAEEKRLKDLEKEAENDKKDKKDDKKKEEKEEIVIDLDMLEDRIVRLTPMSSQLGSAILAKDGEKLFFTAAFEDNYDLWVLDIRESSTRILSKGVGPVSLMLDEKGANLYAFGPRSKQINTASGKPKPISIAASMFLNVAQEREYMFNHVFTQQTKRFYKKDYHGIDLVQLRKDYLPFLPYINNNYDFSELLSEILGELNVSHTGSGYRPSGAASDDATANLGLIYNQEHKGDGLLVDEVIKYSPFDTEHSKVEKGCIIKKIDGVEILADIDFFPLLNRKAGKKLLVTVYNPENKETWDEVVKPVSWYAVNELLYKRWVELRAAETERLSNGKLGYVHIRSMADGSYREVYSEILGRYNHCDGIVIDTRYNGGGRLHEDIEILFSGEKYLEQTIQGVRTCDMPSRRYNKKSIMLVCEANYSNAHGTPWVYSHKGMGSIVGMPVPGTMTSVNWETLQDASMYFGIPVIGYLTKDGQYLENLQLEPDIKVENDPTTVTAGQDLQLEAAVKELLKQIAEDKTAW